MDGQEGAPERPDDHSCLRAAGRQHRLDCDTSTRRTRRFRILTPAIAPVLSALVPSTASPPPYQGCARAATVELDE